MREADGQPELGAFSPAISGDGTTIVYKAFNSGITQEPAWPDCSEGRPIFLPCGQLVRWQTEPQCRLHDEPLFVDPTSGSITDDGSLTAFGITADLETRERMDISFAYSVAGCTEAQQALYGASGNNPGEWTGPTDARSPPCSVWCMRPVIAGDGGAIVFSTWISDLVGEDGDAWPDIFTSDPKTGRALMISDQAVQGPNYIATRLHPISDDAEYTIFLHIEEGEGGECAELMEELREKYKLSSCPSINIVGHSDENKYSTHFPFQGRSMVYEALISGDGNRAFFVVDDEHYFESSSQPPPTSGLGRFLFMFDSADESVHRIWPADEASPPGVRSVTTSDDGRTVAFLVENDGGTDAVIRSQSTSGSWTTNIIDVGPGHRGVEHPHLSGDGTYLAFITDAPLLALDGNEVHDVYRAHVDHIASAPSPRAPAPSAGTSLALFAVMTGLAAAFRHRT